MNNLEQYTHVYFIGIGGIGMSALAQWCRSQGMQVAGYDRNASAITRMLEEKGIFVTYEEGCEHIPLDFTRSDKVLVVYTPAVSQEHPQLCYFRENGFEVIKRAALLGLISRTHRLIAVAGTHGKTTTTAMIAHILQQAGVPVTAFVGGIMRNYRNNLLLSSSPEAWIVAEADEYDRSFLHLHPTIAVVTNIEADHLDIYGSEAAIFDSFEAFLGNIQSGGMLIAHEEVRAVSPASLHTWRYGKHPGCSYSIKELRYENEQLCFTLMVAKENSYALRLQVPGLHNALNATAAFAVAHRIGIAPSCIIDALASFQGVKRRSEVWYRSAHYVLVDDYAHHPTEIESTLQAMRRLYPQRQLVAVFQPHLYTRTRDFAAAFGKALGLADRVLLTPIYPAREAPIEGVDSALIARHCPVPTLIAPTADAIETSLEQLLRSAAPPLTVVVMGAGNIEQHLPIFLNLLKTLEHEQTQA
ncbi:MAG: UDP-N-acetylmuramate--L-alanine ligase [Thermonema sp.]|uniref:UDP-N-acetylmuramate--L-alanine ligase n=1 Tax=Thermonema sp. TaxID=2231181 RepID=UPI0021DD8465|nr:UDP-N-acetylmuramate--L-alanine ligase [Thermonema sp.]GIV39140.1 MAG: UDP-N-acetylmuramate--L-alanine ligase [Thermonema sp.]